MSSATVSPAEGHPTSLGDAQVMHSGDQPLKLSRSTSKNLMTVEVDGVPVHKGTMVIPCERPMFVGQVIRVTGEGMIYVRWFNTRTLEQETTVELPHDSGLKYLVPQFTRNRALAA